MSSVRTGGSILFKKLLLGAALLLAPSLAFGGNAVSSITQKFWKNTTSVAVQAVVKGDDDTSAVCRIWGRIVGTSTYDSLMVMQRRPGTHIYDGRVLWLAKNGLASQGSIAVQFFVRARDGGVDTDAAADTATSRRIPYFPRNGNQFYVDQTNGNDANDATAAHPTKTIGAAVTALQLANAADNSVINVAIGEYHESVLLNQPGGYTDGRHYTLLGASRDSTIICGANPNVEQGLYQGPGTTITWVATGQDSTYKCYFPALTGPADSTQLIVLGFGEYIHRKTSIKAILDDSTLVANSSSSTNQGELSGWFWHNDTLYVKRANGQAPASSGNHFGYRDNPLKVASRNWRIANLTIRYAGMSTSINAATDTVFKNNVDIVFNGTRGCKWKTDPGWDGHGVVFGNSGATPSSGSGGEVDGVTIYGCNSAMVYAPKFANGTRSDSITVHACTLDGLTVGSMQYSAAKSRGEEGINGISMSGMLHEIDGNTIRECFNGISMPNPAALDSTGNLASEYSNNILRIIRDDAIEVDFAYNKNLLVTQNRELGVGSGFSSVPSRWGPIFVIYNEMFPYYRGIKLGGDAGLPNTAVCWFIHNTIYPDNTSTLGNPAHMSFEAVGNPTQHNYFTNNLCSGEVGSLPTVADSARSRTNELNYNGYNQAEGLTLFVYLGVDRNLTAAQSLGWEGNGSTVGGIGFVNADFADVRLTSSDHAITAFGKRITGINTGIGYTRYNGSAPDVGAHPFGWSPVRRYGIWIRRRRGIL